MTFSGDDPGAGINPLFGGDEEDFGRHMLTEVEVTIGDANYKVNVVNKKCMYWSRGWRIGFIRPSWLWSLVSANAARGARVMTYDSDIASDPRPGCGIAGEDVVVSYTTDADLIWDALCVHAAVLDAPVCVTFGNGHVDGMLWLIPEYGVWRTSFEVDGWHSITEPDDDWEDKRKEVELAWDIAWKRIWPGKD